MPLDLSADERAELERRRRAATAAQRDAQRARIILSATAGNSVATVAREVGVHPRTVERWLARFRRKRLDGLVDAPRPGRKPKFGHVTRLELIALACDPIPALSNEAAPGMQAALNTVPPPSEVAAESFRKTTAPVPALASTQPAMASGSMGRTTRTIDDLVDEAVRRGIVDSIGWGTYQRLLASVDLRPHLVDGWVHSPDPQFREKVREITDLYLNPPAGAVVLSIDEKPGMQALERRFPDRPAGPGRKRRREFEYTRHGTQTLLCAFNVHTGEATAVCGPTRKAKDLVEFCCSSAITSD
jgi:transposase-like protein